MEVCHLNAPGLQSYFDAYGRTMSEVSATLGPVPAAWGQSDPGGREEVSRVAAEMESSFPLDSLDGRRRRRDRCLAAFDRMRRQLPP